MKQTGSKTLRKMLNKASLIIASLLLSVYSFAQDKKVEVDVNTKSDSNNNILMQPWVWIVGGAIFILLLVALLRSNRSKD
jgi:cell division protein FtsW (lipid II flippase)